MRRICIEIKIILIAVQFTFLMERSHRLTMYSNACCLPLTSILEYIFRLLVHSPFWTKPLIVMLLTLRSKAGPETLCLSVGLLFNQKYANSLWDFCKSFLPFRIDVPIVRLVTFRANASLDRLRNSQMTSITEKSLIDN